MILHFKMPFRAKSQWPKSSKSKSRLVRLHHTLKDDLRIYNQNIESSIAEQKKIESNIAILTAQLGQSSLNRDEELKLRAAMSSASSAHKREMDRFSMLTAQRKRTLFHSSNVKSIEELLIRCVALDRSNYDLIAAKWGEHDAKYIWRKALIEGWLWFPSQSFPSQGFAALLLRIIITRSETYEALMENLDTVRDRDLKRFGEVRANCLYWYGAVVSIWPLIGNKARKLAIVSGGMGVIHWIRSQLGI